MQEGITFTTRIDLYQIWFQIPSDIKDTERSFRTPFWFVPANVRFTVSHLILSNSGV